MIRVSKEEKRKPFNITKIFLIAAVGFLLCLFLFPYQLGLLVATIFLWSIELLNLGMRHPIWSIFLIVVAVIYLLKKKGNKKIK